MCHKRPKNYAKLGRKLKSLIAVIVIVSGPSFNGSGVNGPSFNGSGFNGLVLITPVSTALVSIAFKGHFTLSLYIKPIRRA